MKRLLARIRAAWAAFKRDPDAGYTAYEGVIYVPSFMPQNGEVVVFHNGPATAHVRLKNPVSHAPSGGGCQGYILNRAG